MVPVLSSRSVVTSPAASTARPWAPWRLPGGGVPVFAGKRGGAAPAPPAAPPRRGEPFVPPQPVHAGDADGAEQGPDGGGDEAPQERDEDHEGRGPAGVRRH